MSPPRIYSDKPIRPGSSHALGDQAAAHLARVLRLAAGDPITLFDGSGIDYAATVLTADRRGVTVSVGAGRSVDNESPLPILLLQGLCRGARMDTVVQKATELGVADIQPVVCERSVVRLDEERIPARLEHWQRIAISACEQCGRAVLPVVRAPLSLDDALCAVPKGTTGLLLDPEGDADLPALLAGSGRVALVIGPEGGFSEAERTVISRHNFARVRLGPRTLRTETAPITALSIIQYARGDLGSR